MPEKIHEVTVRIHPDADGLWAEVVELPGCFGVGDTLEELWESVEESLSLYLSEDGSPVRVKLGDGERDALTERREVEFCAA